MISSKEVQRIAKLARIGLTPQETKNLQKDLSLILDYFDLLKGADVSGAQASFHPSEDFSAKAPVYLREDDPKPKSPELVGKLINMAPGRKDGYLKVNQIL